MSDHARRSTTEASPFLHAFMAWTWTSDGAPIPGDHARTFHWFRGEGFDLIVEDLLSLPNEPGVVVEGFRLLPDLVKPLVAVPGHAVWLLPTPEFRRSAAEGRGSWDCRQRTSDPARARRNLLERDRMFTDRLRAETTRLELAAIDVDIAMTEDELAARVTEAFGL
jgi:hypothetical protein